MKNIFFGIIILSSLLVSCKKDEEQSSAVKLKSIVYTHPTSTNQNRTYTFYRNTNELIDSVVVIYPTNGSQNKTHIFFHTSSRLDSVITYNTSHTPTYVSRATWTGDDLTKFWVLTYAYDSQHRITRKLYESGAYFDITYVGDSAVYMYKPDLATPIHKVYTTYNDNAYHNPFKIYKYENVYAINNYILNGASSDFDGSDDHPYKNANGYNILGVNTRYRFDYSGDMQGYPTKLLYYTNDMLGYTLDFSYE